MLQNELDLPVHRLKSGPLGGDQQIETKIAEEEAEGSFLLALTRNHKGLVTIPFPFFGLVLKWGYSFWRRLCGSVEAGDWLAPDQAAQ